MLKNLLIVGVAAVVLVGCGTPRPGTPEFDALLAKRTYEARIDAAKATASDLPDWYINPPKSDEALTATGSASSADLQLAIDKAVLAAKRSLADQVAGTLSAKHKEFTAEDGVRLTGTTERVTSNEIVNVALSGYSITEKKVIADGPAFRAYVLARYTLPGTAKSTTTAAITGPGSAEKSKAEAAFQDLDRDIKSANASPPTTTVTEVTKVTKAVRIDDPRAAAEVPLAKTDRASSEPPPPPAVPVIPVEIGPPD